MSEIVRWQTDGSIGIITLDRPERLNALSQPVLERLSEVLTEEAADDRIRVVVITGAGDRAFVAGADLGTMKGMNQEEARAWSLLGQRTFALIEDLPKPVIAAINGFALGGGSEIALACDIRLASETAVLGQPEVTLGLPPGFGGTYRLAEVVGVGRARELIMTGRQVDAEEALSMGLVSEVVAPEQLMDRALSLAKKLAANGPQALAHAKRAMSSMPGLRREEAVELEAHLFGRTFATGQPREGISAFLEKRKAEYT